MRYILLPKKHRLEDFIRKILRIIQKKNNVNYGNFENTIYKKEMVKYNNIQFIVE